MAAANVAVAGSAALVLLIGGRTLGPEGLAGLGLAWTVSTIVGFGIAVPAEQTITRRLASGLATKTPIRFLWVATAVVVLLANLWPLASASARGYGGLGWTASLAALGWAAAAPVRARLAATGDLTGYAANLGLEAGSRVALIVASLLGGEALLLGLAVGLPLVIAGAAARVSRSAPWNEGSSGVRSTPRVSRSEHVWITAAALGYQACVNGPPVVFSALEGPNHLAVGDFVVTNAYFRLPTLLAASLATWTLVTVSRAKSGKDDLTARSVTRRALLAALVLTSVAAAALLALASPLLHFALGRPMTTDLGTVAALGSSTVLAVVAAVAASALIGVARPSVPAAGWLLGAACFLIAALVAQRPDGVAGAAALVVGPAVALTTMLGVLGAQGHRTQAQGGSDQS
jgi:O-antigen/teichoic acid export membrane protein